jgi:hypothetical protein
MEHHPHSKIKPRSYARVFPTQHLVRNLQITRYRA